MYFIYISIGMLIWVTYIFMKLFTIFIIYTYHMHKHKHKLNIHIIYTYIYPTIYLTKMPADKLLIVCALIFQSCNNYKMK